MIYKRNYLFLCWFKYQCAKSQWKKLKLCKFNGSLFFFFFLMGIPPRGTWNENLVKNIQNLLWLLLCIQMNIFFFFHHLLETCRALNTECLCSPNSCVELPIPNIIAFRDGTFRNKIGHEDGALTNGISLIFRRDSREQPYPLPCEDSQHTATRHWIWRHLDLGLPGLQNYAK